MALGCTVAELEHRISSRELTEWEIYSRMEPWGEDRLDWWGAMICQILANANRDTQKMPRAFESKDFLPYKTGDDPAKKQDPAWKAHKAFAEMLAGAGFGAVAQEGAE